jgi:hypothetical protein
MPTFSDTVIQASDNKYYKWHGAKWIEVLPNGRQGKIAPFRIAYELERKAVEQGLVSSESVFDDLLASSTRAGLIPERTKKARKWMIEKAQQTRWSISQADVLKENYRAVQNMPAIDIGRLYFFQYDATLSESLEYWDYFPCTMIIDRFKDGDIFGINLHYLPYKERAMLFDSLYRIRNNRKYDETTKLNISYKILKGMAKSKLYLPTLHRYKPEGVKSRFIEIFASEWTAAMFLPLESFKSETQPGIRKEQVWRDSIMRAQK